MSLALLEQNVAVIYIDTSNYVNSDNVTQTLKNYINASDHQEKAETAKEVLGRLRVIKVFDLE